MVPQEPFLFDTTILENVRFGRRTATDDEVRLAFIELGLEPWLGTLADGLATKVGERGEHLSAGERQLVALARAYVANPSCLILDEATSAVDPATEARLARALESLARGPHLGHDRPPAVDGRPRADWVLVFDRGRLVEQGRHDDLLAAAASTPRLHASRGSTPPPAWPEPRGRPRSFRPCGSPRSARAGLGVGSTSTLTALDGSSASRSMAAGSSSSADGAVVQRVDAHPAVGDQGHRLGELVVQVPERARRP